MLVLGPGGNDDLGYIVANAAQARAWPSHAGSVTLSIIVCGVLGASARGIEEKVSNSPSRRPTCRSPLPNCSPAPLSPPAFAAFPSCFRSACPTFQAHLPRPSIRCRWTRCFRRTLQPDMALCPGDALTCTFQSWPGRAAALTHCATHSEQQYRRGRLPTTERGIANTNGSHQRRWSPCG